MEIKDTNPKEALGIEKVPLHPVPCEVLMELGLAMMEGGRKYGTHNYREMGIRASTYYDACQRHLMSWWEGEDIDPDSGIHHVIKAMACLLVVRDSMHMGNVVDDRPLQLPSKIDIDSLNQRAKDIIEKYPECKAPYTQVGSGVHPNNCDNFGCDNGSCPECQSQKKYTVYFSHHIRGKSGENATKEEINENRKDAIEVCNKIRTAFPQLDIYCPAEVDEIVSLMYRNKVVTEKDILDADCEILGKRDMVIAYAKDGYVSRGMKIELEYTKKQNIPYLIFDILSTNSIDGIKQTLKKLGMTNE